MLYSYKGQEPISLPFRVRLDDGSTRTSLNELSPEELEVLGFVGPIVKPEFDKDTQKIEWVDGEYQVIQLTEEEIAQRVAEKEAEERRQKLENVDYNRFWELLITSGVYKKLRTAASQSLVANTLCTELIALFGDAKAGNPNTGIIQQYMNILFFNFEFTPEEVEELQGFMSDTNLDVVYTLPDAEYLSSHTYDPETNTIVGPAPFESWVLVNGKWEAPVPYPTDGKIYNWNENEVNWIAIN
jgi:hypothetical protein